MVADEIVGIKTLSLLWYEYKVHEDKWSKLKADF